VLSEQRCEYGGDEQRGADESEQGDETGYEPGPVDALGVTLAVTLGCALASDEAQKKASVLPRSARRAPAEQTQTASNTVAASSAAPPIKRSRAADQEKRTGPREVPGAGHPSLQWLCR
jgi:hypothetical protein